MTPTLNPPPLSLQGACMNGLSESGYASGEGGRHKVVAPTKSKGIHTQIELNSKNLAGTPIQTCYLLDHPSLAPIVHAAC